MKVKLIVVIILVFPVLGISQVDFESLVLGTQYGAPVGNVSGDGILTENNIPVSVHDLVFVGGGGTFNLSQVIAGSSVFGSGQIMEINNINLQFDFSGLGITPNLVTFEFADLGGDENISVNGQPIFAGELTNAPVNIAPGVMLSMVTMAIDGGITGEATLIGPVGTLRIGGQEFFLDNISARDTTVTSVGDLPSIPKDFVLGQNFPNPFNPETTIVFEVPAAWTAPVTLQIFNIQGQITKTLVDGLMIPGSHTVVWNGKDAKGNPLSSGLYFYQITSGDFVAVRKMLLTK